MSPAGAFFTSTPLTGFGGGCGLISVFINGGSSTSAMLFELANQVFGTSGIVNQVVVGRRAETRPLL
jgi:hypothetical protein